MTFRSLLFFKLCFLFFSYSAKADLLIIQSSDQHSSYKKLPLFLASIEVISRDFKQKYPKGEIVLLINGDFSSKDNHWTTKDRGTLGYEMLS